MSLLTLFPYRVGSVIGFQCWLPATTGTGSWTDVGITLTYNESVAYDNIALYDGNVAFTSVTTGTLSWTGVTFSTCSGV